jgi:DNA-binding protein HU-beta
MTKLVDTIAEQTGIEKKTVDQVLTAFESELVRAIRANEKVRLASGIFSRKDTAGRGGRNPATGAAITIPAKSSIRFKQSTTLKL